MSVVTGIQEDLSRLSLAGDDYDSLYERAKKHASSGDLEQALKYLLACERISSSEKLSKKIRKVKKAMSVSYAADELQSEIMNFFGGGFYVSCEVYEKLYDYQLDGVKWIWELYSKGEGGILGDEMGLGKTIQVIGFLNGLYLSNPDFIALIVLPVSLLSVWENEFSKWCPEIQLFYYHGTPSKRRLSLHKVLRRSGVLLSSYNTIMYNWEKIVEALDDRVWDVMIMDEGHKLKNSQNRTVQAIKSIPSRTKLILTGTAIQNNLEELWSLFDIINSKSILGSKKMFKSAYENPIICGREKDATKNEKILGFTLSKALKEIINPFILRRTKAEIQQAMIKKEMGDRIEMCSKTKYDLILWCKLSDIQIKIYRDFTELAEVKELLNSTRSPLVALGILKKICDHPRLLSIRACLNLGLIEDNCSAENDDFDLPLHEVEHAALRIDTIDVDVLTHESGKLVVLTKLLQRLIEEGHRILIFSMSKKMLDILEKILKSKNFKLLRLDGSVKSIDEREDIVKNWQKKKHDILLLTSQVGGVGLTLTAADRVVIYDPSWNPATDDQAVDRAFRIGQTKDVVVYRLITCGTLEEKIYRRQIFKKSLFHTLLSPSKSNLTRYFSKQELRELFKMDDPCVSITKDQIEEIHGDGASGDSFLTAEINSLNQLVESYGVTNHALMNKLEATDANSSIDDDTAMTINLAKQKIGFETVQSNNIPDSRVYHGGYKRNIAKEPVNLIPTNKQAAPASERQCFALEELKESLNEIICQSVSHEKEFTSDLNPAPRGKDISNGQCDASLSSNPSIILMSASSNDESYEDMFLGESINNGELISDAKNLDCCLVDDSVTSMDVSFCKNTSTTDHFEEDYVVAADQDVIKDSVQSLNEYNNCFTTNRSRSRDHVEVLRDTESMQSGSEQSITSSPSVSSAGIKLGTNSHSDDTENSFVSLPKSKKRHVINSSTDGSLSVEKPTEARNIMKLLETLSPISKRASMPRTLNSFGSESHAAITDKENVCGVQCPTSTPILSRSASTYSPMQPLTGYQLFERELTNASLKYSVSSSSSKASKFLSMDESGKEKL